MIAYLSKLCSIVEMHHVDMFWTKVVNHSHTFLHQYIFPPNSPKSNAFSITKQAIYNTSIQITYLINIKPIHKSVETREDRIHTRYCIHSILYCRWVKFNKFTKQHRHCIESLKIINELVDSDLRQVFQVNAIPELVLQVAPSVRPQFYLSQYFVS